MMEKSSNCTAETLVVIGRHFRGPAGLLPRLAVLSVHWRGPLAAILTEPPPIDADPAELPGRVALTAADGPVAEALRTEAPADRALVAAAALLDSLTKSGRFRIHFIADEESFHQLPAFARAAGNVPVELEWTGAGRPPDVETLWPWAESLLITDISQQPVYADEGPCLPWRLLPPPEAPESGTVWGSRPGTGAPCRVSVVVPVRGRGDLVLRMAQSVFENTTDLAELILVDDASPDRTLSVLEKIARRNSLVRIFANPEQKGFAATCNRGLAAARGEVVIVLNADTIVTPGWSERLTWHLLTQPRIGAVGPLSNRVSGIQQLQPVEYDEKTLAGLIRFSHRVAQLNPGQASGVVRLTGLAVAFHRTALRRVGGFDPRFFPGNFEDDDMSLRLLAAGMVPYVAHDTFIHHEGQKSFALEADAYRKILEDNWNRFKAKWGLPEERPVERHYSVEELPLHQYRTEDLFIAPWHQEILACC